VTKTRLLIARHGNTFGSGDTVTRLGKTDLPLVESGLEQGRMLGRYLKREGLIPDIAFTSHLQRTAQTMEQIKLETRETFSCNALTIFNEIDYGPDENQPEKQVVRRVGEDAIKAWDLYAIVPQGWKVDTASIIANWKQFADKLVKEHAGKTILVVTSNGIARFAPHLTGDFEGFRKEHTIKIATGALCVFEHEDGAHHWHCTGWNLKPKALLAE